jgi:hypothetical protein
MAISPRLAIRILESTGDLLGGDGGMAFVSYE